VSKAHAGQQLHKAFVAVDEMGTKAAAATAVVLAPRGASFEEVIDLKVDHPFLFFIRSTNTGELLFAGRVTNPKA
jgi:serpin B